jgi:tRNA pseudouridine55 synthase
MEPVTEKIGEGIIAVWKPSGVSSYGMISRVRRASGIRTVGHAGTLDPLARGVLVVGIGRAATRRLNEEVAKEKEYNAIIRLGITSETDDEEGIKTAHSVSSIPSRLDVEDATLRFVGAIMQVPPPYSALKVGGARAYALSRKGAPPVLKARSVFIKEIKVLSYDYPDISIQVVTGPGVYIRALARDIGVALGTGAYMADLERTRVGEFTKDQCYFL